MQRWWRLERLFTFLCKNFILYLFEANMHEIVYTIILFFIFSVLLFCRRGNIWLQNIRHVASPEAYSLLHASLKFNTNFSTYRARFGSTPTKIGTIQRRLAWPLAQGWHAKSWSVPHFLQPPTHSLAIGQLTLWRFPNLPPICLQILATTARVFLCRVTQPLQSPCSTCCPPWWQPCVRVRKADTRWGWDLTF